jgi:hypothetical protein
LSSTDWSTFNGKQAALVSGSNIKTVGGTSLLGSGDLGTIGVAYGGTGATSLTSGYLLKGNGTSAVSASVVYDNGTNVGIGLTSPSSLLHVKRGSNATEIYPSGTWASRIINATDASTENGLLVGNRWAASSSTVFEAGSIYGSGSIYWSSYYKIDGVGQHYWGTGASGTESMRLNTTGLGIGTTAPATIIHAVASGPEVRVQNTNTGQYQSGRVRLKGPAGTYRATQLVHGNENAGGTNTYFSIESADSSDNYQSTIAYYNYASQYWQLSTNNTGRMYIDSSGNVGIGSFAGVKFDVYGRGRFLQDAAPTTGAVVIRQSASDVWGGFIQWVNNANSSEKGWLSVDTSSNMVFGPNSTERMRIGSGGNVGIGTSTLGRTLCIYDSDMWIRNVNANRSWLTGLSTGFDYLIYDETAGLERFRITTAGRVGIGVSSPNRTLDVNGDAYVSSSFYVGQSIFTGYGVSTGDCAMELGGGRSSSGNSYIDFHGAAGTDFESRIIRYAGTNGGMDIINGGTGGMVLSVGGAAPMTFQTNSSERMRIGSNGAVAIGGAGVDASLHIQQAYGGYGRLTQISASGATADAFNIMAARSGSSDLWWSWGVDSSNRWRINQGVGFSTNGLAMTDVGNIGMGSLSPSGKLHVETTSTGDVIYIAANTGGTAGQSVYIIPVRTAGTLRGGIQWNGSNLLYNNSSDARLKDNVADADDTASLIDAIQVRKFDWKESGTHQRYGFIAQELIEVAPEAVHQPEDEEEMMGVDYSKLVPMLIKEVQSLRARVAQLEGK